MDYLISDIIEIEKSAKELGSNLTELCVMADVDRSTLTRLKQSLLRGGDRRPSLRVLERLNNALNDLSNRQTIRIKVLREE